MSFKAALEKVCVRAPEWMRLSTSIICSIVRLPSFASLRPEDQTLKFEHPTLASSLCQAVNPKTCSPEASIACCYIYLVLDCK